MKRTCALLLFLSLLPFGARGYNDHRGHNLDSLELAVAKWTADKILSASEEDLVQLNRAYRDLMLGYHGINDEKGMFYARAALSVSRRQGWTAANFDAYRYIGMMFYGREQYDSAMFYYNQALSSIEAMEAGATSTTNPEGYTEENIDDAKSSLYGTIGNLLNVQGDIPAAMEYYEKAGEIFEKRGWNESNSILYYNIGETWVDEGDAAKAREAYDKALRYAKASGDSLMIANAYKGFGNLYSYEGRTGRALKALRKADSYYRNHQKEEQAFRLETMDYMSQVLAEQKKRLTAWLVALALVLAAAAALLLIWRKAAANQGPSAGGAHPGDGPSARPAVKGPVPTLNDRETSILAYIAGGLTNTQISEKLFLSPETIKWYRKKLLVKFDVTNSAELVSKAKEMGLI